MAENKSSGIGFFGLLTIVFIVLKLLNIIAWSWIWVLSPIIFSITIVILFALAVGILSYYMEK